ncbi:hypothetical protein FDA94_04400 [Herbidospora galbida]|uniref:Uncharacterized protein n=1 Tax=Herbidospora galbida TaxID=2575442 RepID=A0A4U3MPH8_9ACTN|nr:hypothetical protein [Herbidospora galbida]TKK91000.1 hypothetical protein FDA94_04400 [Herbidospora galbida]
MRGQDSASEHDHEGKVPPPSFGQSARDENYPQPGEGSGNGWFAVPTTRPAQPEWPPAPAAPPAEPPTWPPAPAREPEDSGGWFAPEGAERSDEPGSTWPAPRSWQPPAPVTEHTPEAPPTGHFGFPKASPDPQSAWPPPAYDPQTEETRDPRAPWPVPTAPEPEAPQEAPPAWPAYDPQTEETRDTRSAWPAPAHPENDTRSAWPTPAQPEPENDTRSAWPGPAQPEAENDTRSAWPTPAQPEPENDTRSAWPAPVYDPGTEETRDSRAAWPPIPPKPDAEPQLPEGDTRSAWVPVSEGDVDTQDTRGAWPPPVYAPDTEETRDRDAAWPVPAYDPETEETRDHGKAGSWPPAPAQEWPGWPAAPTAEPTPVEEPTGVDATTSGLPPLPEWPADESERPGEPGDIAVWPPRLPVEESAAPGEPVESHDDPPVYPRHWPAAAHAAGSPAEPDTGVATVPGDRPEATPWPPAQQWASDTGTPWPSAAIPDEEPAETTIPREEQPAFQAFDPAVQESPQAFGAVNGTAADVPTDPEMPLQKVDPQPEQTQENLFTPPVPPAAPASPGRGFESLGAAPVTEGIVHPPLPKGYRPAEAAPITEVPVRKKGGGVKKVLLAGGSLVVIAAIGASAYMAYAGEDEPANEAAAPPVTNAPAAPGGEADPAPTVEAAMLDSETTDPRKLTINEAFPDAKISVNGRTFKRVKVNVTDDCASAAAGAFAQSLSENDCRRVLRATYVDGKKQYAVTTGIAVLPTKDAALAVDQTKNLGSNLWFRGLNGDPDSGADRVAISGGYAAGMVWGRYIVFSYATYADGHTPAEKEKDLGPVSGAFRDQTAEIIEKRVTG